VRGSYEGPRQVQTDAGILKALACVGPNFKNTAIAIVCRSGIRATQWHAGAIKRFDEVRAVQRELPTLCAPVGFRMVVQRSIQMLGNA
jgi:hypothetical protein